MQKVGEWVEAASEWVALTRLVWQDPEQDEIDHSWPVYQEMPLVILKASITAISDAGEGVAQSLHRARRAELS